MRMKHLYLLMIALTAGACTNDAPVDQTPASSMVLSTQSISLSKSVSIDSAIAKLACGCDFQYSVDWFRGDTSVIRYVTNDVGNIFGNARSFVFEGDTNAAAGAYEARLYFRIWEPDEPGVYGDTLLVTFNN
jgi:hypothetical protein